MKQSMVKFVLILLLAKISQLDGRAVEVIYNGQGCECQKALPYEVSIPVPPVIPPALPGGNYDYRVEVPPPATAKYSYSFDFLVESPLPAIPPIAPKEDLLASVDRLVISKPDCTLAPAPLNPPMVIANPLSLKPPCRYVLRGIQTNEIIRSRRDISSRKQDPFGDLFKYFKTLKKVHSSPIIKRSKIVKRDIKGEYDMLKTEQDALDLTIPEVIQYMPETLNPNFKRGKCAFGCKNCINKHHKQNDNNFPFNTPINNNNSPQQPRPQLQKQQQQPLQASVDNTQTFSNQQIHMRPHFNGVNYLKRNVNPYQYQYSLYPTLMPPPYIPNPLHLATLAKNPSNPIWYQPRPLIDPNGHYVYDRLGHKYEIKNDSLKLLPPSQNADEAFVSASATAENEQSTTTTIDPTTGTSTTTAGGQTSTASTTSSSAAHQLQSDIDIRVNAQLSGQRLIPRPPMVGSPAHQSADPEMDKVIRDIIYRHPDFIDATEHAPSSLTQPQNMQTDETMQFLGKLIRGRLNNWFGVQEEVPTHNLQDLNRYSRETGTSIKFIPIVTVDQNRFDRYRQERAQSIN